MRGPIALSHGYSQHRLRRMLCQEMAQKGVVAHPGPTARTWGEFQLGDGSSIGTAAMPKHPSPLPALQLEAVGSPHPQHSPDHRGAELQYPS